MLYKLNKKSLGQHHTCLTLVVLCLSCPFIAHAQQTPSKQPETSIQKAPNHLEFKAIRNKSGQIELKISPDNMSKAAEWMSQSPNSTPSKFEILSGKKFSFIEVPNWYVTISPEGKIGTIFGLTEGRQLQGDIINKIPPGYKILKQDSAQFASYVSATLQSGAVQLVKDTLTKMANEAVTQVCSFKVKPSKFSMDAEVEVSLGVGGKIKFGMEWQTSDICR